MTRFFSLVTASLHLLIRGAARTAIASARASRSIGRKPLWVLAGAVLLGACQPEPVTLAGQLGQTLRDTGAHFTVAARASDGALLAETSVDAFGRFTLVVPPSLHLSAQDLTELAVVARAGRVELRAQVSGEPSQALQVDEVSTLKALGLVDTAEGDLALALAAQLRGLAAGEERLLERHRDTPALLTAMAQDPAQLRLVRLRYHHLLMAEAAARLKQPNFAVPNAEMTQLLRLDQAALPLRWQHRPFSETPWVCVDFFERGNRYGYTGRDWPLGVRLVAVDAMWSGLSRQTSAIVINALNAAEHCRKTNWRLPTLQELRTLFDRNTGEFLYPNNLPFTRAGNFWVMSDKGTPEIISLPSQQINGTAASAQLLPWSFTADAPPPANPIVDSQFDATELRKLYQTAPEQWPAPTIDKGVGWRELGQIPAVPFPADNPYTKEKVALGKQLFFDVNLSAARNTACASCHLVAEQWSDKRRVSIGTHDTPGKRNAMPILNTAFNPVQFWDGRAITLEDQSLHPIEDRLEMALTREQLLERLREQNQYQALYQAAFGSPEITLEGYQQALATYQRTLISLPAPLDKFIAGDYQALTDEQVVGLHLYRTKARCMNCHSGPLMTDYTFRNTGLTYYGRELEDNSLFAQSFLPADMGRFRVPSLRDVAFSAPYMHNGVFGNLAGAINFYNVGMTKGRNANYPQYQHKYDPFFPVVDDLILPLGMTREEMRALIMFLSAISAPARTDSAPLEVLLNPASEVHSVANKSVPQ